MKTLIFGPGNAGKTSLMRTVSQGYSFIRVMDIPATRGISRENYLFRGLLEITIWDAGGQDKYMERYFSEAQREIVFGDVEIPIFVADSTVTDLHQVEIFQQFLENLIQYSPEIKAIYVFINKNDIPESKPDLLLQQLKAVLKAKGKELCQFSIVSVKEGTAQQKLIEILDSTLQDSINELEKLKKIRLILNTLKEQIQSDLIVFNRPDGLITTSTFGEIRTDPLNFLSLDIGTLESNIDSIFGRIQNRLGRSVNPLHLSVLMYETETQNVIFKEIEDYAMLMIITPNKTPDLLSKIFTLFQNNSQLMQELKILLKHH